MKTLCPCGSQSTYADCCEPYILATAIAPTPGKLMRSRYTAYVKHQAEYLIKTWHPDYRSSIDRDAIIRNFNVITWLDLTVLEENSDPDKQEGVVEFIARFIDKHHEGIHELHERSRFLRVEGHWYYVDRVTPLCKKRVE